ncbi:MAG: hypothetical protein WCW90_00780 [Candidatus Paceibacterota bacterium]|jgi:hypothetical protein
MDQVLVSLLAVTVIGLLAAICYVVSLFIKGRSDKNKKINKEITDSLCKWSHQDIGKPPDDLWSKPPGK